MPDLSPFHPWIVFVHVVGVFIFLLAHGVSAGVMLRLRQERHPVAVRTLLDLSERSLGVMTVGFLAARRTALTPPRWRRRSCPAAPCY